MPQAEIGIIGGSGLYSMPGLTKVKEVRLKTPFGAPSDAYVLRHARGPQGRFPRASRRAATAFFPAN